MDKTLLKGLSVLEAVINLRDGVQTIDELANHVGLTRSNAHRTLQTLVHAGYVERDPVFGGFRGTMKMFELGARSLRRLDVRKIAPPYLEQLADATRETVHLSVLDGLDVVYIDKIDGALPIRSYTSLGGRAPAYAVATGKALLAHQSAHYLDQFDGKFEPFTNLTITNREALMRELEKVRKTGYSVNRGEWREGVGGLAAPIVDGSDKVVAAIGISCPTDRLPNTRIKELGPLVARVAFQLSRAMGCMKDYAFGA